MIFKKLKLIKFSKFLTTFSIVVMAHFLLLLHLTVCSHKSEAYEVVPLNISIEPQSAGIAVANFNTTQIPKRLPDGEEANAIVKEVSKRLIKHELEKTESNKKSAKRGAKKPSANRQALGTGGGKFNVLPVNLSPKFLRYQPPSYPALARRLGQQGTVVVDVKLTELGQNPASIHISSGYKLLDRAAINAANNSVLSSVFKGMENESELAYIARIKYQFQLERK